MAELADAMLEVHVPVRVWRLSPLGRTINVHPLGQVRGIQAVGAKRSWTDSVPVPAQALDHTHTENRFLDCVMQYVQAD